MKRIIIFGLCAVSVVVFGASSVYDDLGDLRPAGGSNDFWNTSNHAEVAIDVTESVSASIDARVPQVVSGSEPLGWFDSRWLTYGVSIETIVSTLAKGTLMLFR
jgi:hypothetical protein